MVLEILGMEGIPLVKQDIGGHFQRVLKLELATGQTDIRIRGKEEGRPRISEATGKIKFRDLMRRIDRLKPLPEIARRIISRIEYSGSSLSDLEKYILKDQAITANVLKSVQLSLLRPSAQDFEHQEGCCVDWGGNSKKHSPCCILVQPLQGEDRRVFLGKRGYVEAFSLLWHGC